jgi:hypothetical protein
MSWNSSAAACSTSTAVGVKGSSLGGGQALNTLSHSSFSSGSIRKPGSLRSCGIVVVVCRWPVICRSAWSEPRLPSQSIRKFVKVPSCIAATLYHARSMTESRSCSVPRRVTSPGVLASTRRLVAAHSSMRPAQVDRGMVGGDHHQENWNIVMLQGHVTCMDS